MATQRLAESDVLTLDFLEEDVIYEGNVFQQHYEKEMQADAIKAKKENHHRCLPVSGRR